MKDEITTINGINTSGSFQVDPNVIDMRKEVEFGDASVAANSVFIGIDSYQQGSGIQQPQWQDMNTMDTKSMLLNTDYENQDISHLSKKDKNLYHSLLAVRAHTQRKLDELLWGASQPKVETPEKRERIKLFKK